MLLVVLCRLFCLLVIPLFTAPSRAASIPIKARQSSPYAPVPAQCPSGRLVRPATRLSTGEKVYIRSRKRKADAALAKWIRGLSCELPTSNLPSVGFTVSGGGYRSLLEGAGVMQAFDARDGDFKTSGIYQTLTYQAGLSGGGWFLSSVAGNNYPTVTSLRTNLWEQSFSNSPLDPSGTAAAAATAQIFPDLAAKRATGFDVTVVDPYGRFISYTLLDGPDGGVATRLSSITGFSNFTSYNAPYPIITALGVDAFANEFIPTSGDDSTQYEFHPYEFGSWDEGVSAFTRTAYLGTSLNNGRPTSGSCIQNYDNLAYVLGTSSNLFNLAAADVGSDASTSASPIAAQFQALDLLVQAVNGSDLPDELFGIYRNPFAGYRRSSLVSAQPRLTLVDGGSSLQNNPIWPFIQKTKRVDVLIVNDNSADTAANFPNGSEIQTTYLRAKQEGLARMPFIPSPEIFVSEGLDRRASFFGCDNKDELTIIYLPNYNFTYPSGQNTFKLQYSVNETRGMIENGVQIGLQGGAADWPTCLGCAMVKKTGHRLPRECTKCFHKYCYRK